MSIEKKFDIPFVTQLALREKQSQQSYRPIIAVHKWFARRPGSLFRSLLLAEFADEPLRESYYQSHNYAGRKVADPFMGGGSPLFEANRLGFDVIGYDVNPMSYWVVSREIEHLDPENYLVRANEVKANLERQVGTLYTTTCLSCGHEAPVKYFLWVKVQKCKKCGQDIDLFPGYLLANNARHPRTVLVCSICGELVEVNEKHNPGCCPSCGHTLTTRGSASRSRCTCSNCGASNTYPNGELPQHRMFALEYHCPHCKPTHRGRFFKKPDLSDLNRYELASRLLQDIGQLQFIPDEQIPSGDETDRLHRWGYYRYSEMFNKRQLLSLELLAREIACMRDGRLKKALATNFSDLLRYQNMLCRYDTTALKSLDIFSVHGFPVGLIQCESNIIGIEDGRVGSGGWANIVAKYGKAKEYCVQPFEPVFSGRRKKTVTINEQITDIDRSVELYCASSTSAKLEQHSLDAVLTDPPYLANVQYAELMDFCYVWLRKLVNEPAFNLSTTRNMGDLTGNRTMERGLEHFAKGLSCAFTAMAKALKPGKPFVFTYHHNDLEAYYPVVAAILDAGMICTAIFPCPGEMLGSIHISGTSSSSVDSVFVCRELNTNSTVEQDPIPILLEQDVLALSKGGLKVSPGDLRCLYYGRLCRAAVSKLSGRWNQQLTTQVKLELIDQIIKKLDSEISPQISAIEKERGKGELNDAISV